MEKSNKNASLIYCSCGTHKPHVGLQLCPQKNDKLYVVLEIVIDSLEIFLYILGGVWISSQNNYLFRILMHKIHS